MCIFPFFVSLKSNSQFINWFHPQAPFRRGGKGSSRKTCIINRPSGGIVQVCLLFATQLPNKNQQNKSKQAKLKRTDFNLKGLNMFMENNVPADDSSWQPFPFEGLFGFFAADFHPRYKLKRSPTQSSTEHTTKCRLLS